MKAFLLAAGLGTRLRPLTDTMPKCLVPINGKPLMAWWLELFQKHGVDTVLVNTHYLSDQVRVFIEKHNEANPSVRVIEAYEPTLLGSGGTIATNREFVGRDESFLICYADNLTNIDLFALLRFHEKHDSVLTMALFRTNVPKQCGIAELDAEGKIINFVEKPETPASDLANAGVYVARKELFTYLSQHQLCDLGKDILPKLTGKMYGYEIQDYLIDIGTLQNLKKARDTWQYDYI